MKVVAVLLLASLILAGAAYLRAAEYDEAYSIFLTAGDARPNWPASVFRAGDVRGFYIGHADMARIAQNLRHGDVHPPLYFWMLEYWRRIAGPSWFAARLLSVLFSVTSLAALARLAVLTEVPVIPAMLVALLSYGFAYTGIVARGFALAQMLNLLGIAAIFSGSRKSSPASALAGGLALGAATFANYLACFTGLAMLAWLIWHRRWRIFVASAFGFALFIPADAYFFLAQKSSRIGQFIEFTWPHALALLAKDSGAALFGGLPVYAGHFEPAVAATLAMLFFICLYFVIRNRKKPAFGLFAVAAAATPIGLLALGLIFGNTPVEIRYLAFSLPFVALLLAASLPRPLLYLVLAVDAAAIAGLALAPATMQPQARAARQLADLNTGNALILLPYGNDGVGIPGPFIQASPDRFRIMLIKPDEVPNLSPNLSKEDQLFLADINVDAASHATTTAIIDMMHKDRCWRETNDGLLLLSFANGCAVSLHQH